MEQTKIFNDWLDAILSENPFPSNTMAINFNLYEMDDSFDVQLIGSSMYDEDNDDWACEETFSSEENCLILPKITNLDDREIILEAVTVLIDEYLNSGKYSHILKQFVAVCIGFVDDKIECVWLSDDEE